METTLWFVIATIILTLAFDFLNGFHDAANAIATVVSTHVLKPVQAVLWAAIFNFLAVFIFGVHVANTVGTGIIDPHIVTPLLIFVALSGAIIWNIFTWYIGLPSSSSHALMGGLIGAALFKKGLIALKWKGLIPIIISIFLSPLIGMILGIFIMWLFARVFYHFAPQRVDRIFRGGQLFTSALLSLAHGGNDAQKSMGIIALLLFSANLSGPTFHVPFWVIVSCYLTISLGTFFGGFRIVRTLGLKITKLKPIGGCAAEVSSAFTLFLATGLGIPVSTTHTITGGVVGVGALQRLSAVRWGVAHQIVWAWIFTIPASALLSAVLLYVLSWVIR